MSLRNPIRLDVSPFLCVMEMGVPHLQTRGSNKNRRESTTLEYMPSENVVKGGSIIEAYCRFADNAPFLMD